MIFQFPQFFGEDPDTKLWSGELVAALNSFVERNRDANRDNIASSAVTSDTFSATYAEIATVSLKCSGGTVRVDFGCSSTAVPDLKLQKNSSDVIEILNSSGNYVHIDSDRDEGVCTYSLQAKEAGSTAVNDIYLVAQELKGV